MENASKALIIAGAILLSILLISLGILIYNNAKGTVDEANLSDQEIQTFNSRFSGFLGENKSPETVEQLIQTAYEFYLSNTKGALGTGQRATYFATGPAKTNPTVGTNKDDNRVDGILKNKTVTKGQMYKIQAVYWGSGTSATDTKYKGAIKGFYISPAAW